MNNEEIWQMGGVKSYEVIDQIKADSDLSMSSGSAKRIGEAIEYGDWYQDPFDGWTQVTDEPIEGLLLVGKPVTKNDTFFNQNK